MKPETKQLRAVLRDMGVRPEQVRSDRMQGTTATVFDEDGIAALTGNAHELGAAGYAVLIHRDEHGAAYLALVTTDVRRARPVGGAA